MSKDEQKTAAKTVTVAGEKKAKKPAQRLSAKPAHEWGQKDLNKILARVEDDFKLVPQHLRYRARDSIFSLINDMTWTDASQSAPVDPRQGNLLAGAVGEYERKEKDVQSIANATRPI